MTTIEKLRHGIYSTQESRDLAAEIIQLLERNYPCVAQFWYYGIANNVIGDIAKALGVHAYKINDFFEINIEDTGRDNQVNILIRSTYQPQ